MLPIVRDGLVLELHFNELNGSTVYDLSGNNNHGTIYGATRVQEGFGRALLFDGVDDKVDIPYSPILNPPEFSLLAWAMVKGGQGTWRSVITSRVAPPLKGYIIYAGNDNYWQFWVGNGSSWIMVYGPPVELNKWVFLVATYDGTYMRFYVNRVMYGPKSTVYLQNDISPTRIGAGATEGSGDYWFNGIIDEVLIYNRALSESEIKAIYNYYMKKRM